METAEVYGNVAEAIANCSLIVGTTAAGARRQPQHALHPLIVGAARIREHIAQGAKAALLFGSEKRGLSNEDLSHCDFLLRIPTREEHPSMNLGQAVAVALYEIARDGAPSPAADKVAATAGELERVNGLLLEALRRSGYFNEQRSASSLQADQEKVRRLAHRLQFGTEDAQLFTGMLRQVLWKLGTENK